MNRLNSRHVASILPGLMAALLVVICWHFARPSTASTDLLVARADSSGQLEYATQPTGTVPVTVTTFLPFIARNCRFYVFDDFSNPESGWGTATRPYARSTTITACTGYSPMEQYALLVTLLSGWCRMML